MDVPELTVRPPIRCFYRPADHPSAICGRDATWFRLHNHDVPMGYFCELHRQAEDVPVVAAPLCRRVSVTIEVLLTGTSFAAESAQREAVATLERAVESVGGVINLHAVHSLVGRYGPRVPAGRRNGVGPLPS